MPEQNDLEALGTLLRVYAHAQRLTIVKYVLGGERSVSQIEQDTGITQPSLSQQLAELRRAGILASRRDGKQVFYTLANVTQTVRSSVILDLLHLDAIEVAASDGLRTKFGARPDYNEGVALFPRILG